MKTLDEIRNTPVLLLTPDEIEQLEPDSQAWARECQSARAREDACPKHEPAGTSSQHGWHNLCCRHCGKDMSYDSGD